MNNIYIYTILEYLSISLSLYIYIYTYYTMKQSDITYNIPSVGGAALAQTGTRKDHNYI